MKKIVSFILTICTLVSAFAIFVIPVSASASSTKITTSINGITISTSDLTVKNTKREVTLTANIDNPLLKINLKKITLEVDGKTYSLKANYEKTIHVASALGIHTATIRIDFFSPVPVAKKTTLRYLTISFQIIVVKDVEEAIADMKIIYAQGSTYPKYKNAGCHSFACEFMQKTFGTKKPSPSNKEYTYIYATSKSGKSQYIRPLDLVRYRIGNNYDHTILITKIKGDTIYYCDCNSDLHNTVKYNQSMKLDRLESLLKNSLLDRSISTYGYICHFENNYL